MSAPQLAILPAPRRFLPKGQPERLAICLLRRASQGRPPCAAVARCTDLHELSESAAALAGFMVSRRSEYWQVLLGHCGSTVLTRDERRLLRALAAAQAGDEALLDNHLFRLALDRRLRAELAAHVGEFAAMLAVWGHWLSPAGWWINGPGSRAPNCHRDR